MKDETEREGYRRALLNQVDNVLNIAWADLMDGPDEKAAAVGMIFMAEMLGLLDGLQVTGWYARLERCRDMEVHGTHVGGRDWCAFCGEIERRDDQTIALAGSEYV